MPTMIPPITEEALSMTRASIDVFGRPGFTDIMRERCEQIDVHGFTLDHDLGLNPVLLAYEAQIQLHIVIDHLRGAPHPRRVRRPFGEDSMPDQDGAPRDRLVKAAAILWALIDRIDGPLPAPETEGAA